MIFFKKQVDKTCIMWYSNRILREGVVAIRFCMEACSTSCLPFGILGRLKLSFYLVDNKTHV